MILIRAFKQYHGKRTQAIDQRIIMKFENEHDFNFDIYKPENWKRWLSKYKDKKGNLLPRKDKDGMKIVYNVYVFGVPEWFEMKPISGSYLSLFPGYDKFGTHKKIAENGELYPLKR